MKQQRCNIILSLQNSSLNTSAWKNSYIFIASSKPESKGTQIKTKIEFNHQSRGAQKIKYKVISQIIQFPQLFVLLPELFK